MSKYLAVTGFFATGSSAVLDLLNGNKDYNICPSYSYEHVFLYTPGSVFDLEWKLLYCNDLHRSNEAISTFVKEMDRLKQNFGWFGSYKKMFGKEFDSIINSYVDSLIDYKHKLVSYSDYKTVRFSIIKLIVQIGAKLLTHRKIYSYGRRYIYIKNSKNQYAAHPSNEKFYKSSSLLIKQYAELFAKKDCEINVFDHFVLPNHLNRIDKYFDKDFKFIVVTRDPRDLFILSKYIYSAKNPFPVNVIEFCKFYKKQHEFFINSNNVLSIFFEDLVYNEKMTRKRILEFCGTNDYDYESKFFSNKSINNTQVFLLNNKWKKEVAYIEENLSDYLYHFPYIRIPKKDEIFE